MSIQIRSAKISPIIKLENSQKECKHKYKKLNEEVQKRFNKCCVKNMLSCNSCGKPAFSACKSEHVSDQSVCYQLFCDTCVRPYEGKKECMAHNCHEQVESINYKPDYGLYRQLKATMGSFLKSVAAMTTKEKIAFLLDLKTHPDFPKKGVLFYDIFSMLRKSVEGRTGLAIIKDLLIERYENLNIDRFVLLDARGFLFTGVAEELGIGIEPIRKDGKLPGELFKVKSEKEYGKDVQTLEVDSDLKGKRVVILDDLLATGGTMEATIKLLRKAGAEIVEACNIYHILPLGGKGKIQDEYGVNVHIVTAPSP